MSQRLLNRRNFLTFAGGAVASAAVFRGRPGVAFAADAIPVVASFSILGDWVANVGGDRIKVSTIVPAGGDAHTFDPKPETVATIADAKAILAIGPAFEPWLDDVVTSSGTSGDYVHLSDTVKLVDHHKSETSQAAEASPAAEEHEGGDPHIWGDVKNVITSVGVIKDTLSKIDADGASAYSTKADDYTKQLNDLDAWIRTEVEKLPKEKRRLVTNHDTLGYFADAYGFQIVGTALGSFSTEAGDPSAETISKLVKEIKDAGVPAIFAENVANPDLMNSIAKEAGVTLAPPLFSDALGEPGSEGDTYLKMMKYNVTTIVKALSA